MRLTKLLPLTALALTAAFAAPSFADPLGSPAGAPRPPDRSFADPPAQPNPTAVIKQIVLKRRNLQIQRLRQYRQRGMFPRNTYANKILRVLVDGEGRFCAVANLIALDGQRLLVVKTAKTQRFVNFANLKGGPLVDWVGTSGFTMAEIAAIQLPDSPIMDMPRPEIARPEPKPDPVQVAIALERTRLTKHLLTVERLLLGQTDKSVDAIVANIIKNRKLVVQLMLSQRFTNVQPI